MKGLRFKVLGIVEKLETDRVVILSDAKNLHMNQVDSSVVKFTHMDCLRNDRWAFLTCPSG
ncbi:MAG: hypothetical protein ACE5KJ_06130, partial [Candidatus Zixiibacteriota bacterium]